MIGECAGVEPTFNPLRLANCFPASLQHFADFFLALIHPVLHLCAGPPNFVVGGVQPIQTLVRDPVSSLCPGFWSQEQTYRGAEPESCYQVRNG